DKNWVSIPYNTSYANASDAYTDIGISVCYGIRKLDAVTQLYTTCYWDSDLEMFINDYPVVLGIAYEILVSTDAAWTPDVYTNRGDDIVSTPVKERLGTMAVIKDPNWPVIQDEERASVISDDALAVRRSDVSRQQEDRQPYSIRGRIKGDASGLAMRCYVVSRPDELLTESVQSCGIRSNGKATVWWAELGNLPTAWRAGDEVVVLLSKEGFYGTASYRLDGKSDMVKLSDITLSAVPEVEIKQNVDGSATLSWTAVEDPLVIGYSVYRVSDNQICGRLNDKIIKGTTFTINNAATEGQYELQLVFAGGWESGFYPRIADKIADGVQSGSVAPIPVAFALGQVRPNPFAGQTAISFAVAQTRHVELKIYDIAGKLVRTLKNEVMEPGYYNVNWDALDNMSRPVGMGVYFCKFMAGNFSATHKIVVAK
ncbi:MAG TPA: T9SS type A sorting domain-containing protein, partial [bacterium]